MPQDRNAGKASIKKYLKTANKSWKDSKTYHEEHFGKKAPSGDHTVLLIGMDIGVNDERLIVKPKWEIVDGESKGFTVFGDTLWLHTPGAQAFFRNWCIQVDEEPPEDIEEELEEFCKKCIKNSIYCQIRVSYKDEDVDTFPDKVVVISREHDYQSDETSNRKDETGRGESRSSGGGGDLDEMSRKELIKHVEDEGLDKKIKDYDEMSKKELMEAIVGSQESSSKSKDDNEEVDVSLDAFEEFTDYCSLSPKKKDKTSKSGMIKFLKNFEFVKKDNLKSKHKAFLEALGLEDLVVDE